ncbi:hypothetical protein [Agaribacter flavus]|uniref:Uncharacterized protein n=1 Tax=Agaribacter flavus TaxID=1902781 RepID=A0ABV7FWN6_9ALTE
MIKNSLCKLAIQKYFLLLIIFGLVEVNGVNAFESKDEAGQAYECTQVKIDELDPTLLTRAEKIQRMERILHDSIDSYATCINVVQKNMASSGNETNKGDSVGQGEAESARAESEQKITEATDPVKETKEVEASESQTPHTQQKATKRGLIKPKNNDAIICQLLWEEIQKATGTARSGFEKQYRQYKCG